MVNKPLNVTYEEDGPQILERDMSRAVWQRTIGAVVMQELTEDALSSAPGLDYLTAGNLDYEIEAECRIPVDVSALWASAYAVSHLAVRSAFKPIFKRVEQLEVDVLPDKYSHDLSAYTYWKNNQDLMLEAQQTVTHFPVSLARSVCLHANNELYGRTSSISVDDRFSPRSLDQIADLLDSPDIISMYDQSLFAANGFWKGFSTSTRGIEVGAIKFAPYKFIEDRVAFSELTLRDMRSSVKDANNARPVMKQKYSPTSSSGCPARFTNVSASLGTTDAHLVELAEAFGKTSEELLAPREFSPARLGLQFVARSLREASPIADKFLKRREDEITARNQYNGRNQLISRSRMDDLLYKP